MRSLWSVVNQRVYIFINNLCGYLRASVCVCKCSLKTEPDKIVETIEERKTEIGAYSKEADNERNSGKETEQKAR